VYYLRNAVQNVDSIYDLVLDETTNPEDLEEILSTLDLLEPESACCLLQAVVVVLTCLAWVLWSSRGHRGRGQRLQHLAGARGRPVPRVHGGRQEADQGRDLEQARGQDDVRHRLWYRSIVAANVVVVALIAVARCLADQSFVDMLLMTYKSFTTPDKMLTKIIQRFQAPSSADAKAVSLSTLFARLARPALDAAAPTYDDDRCRLCCSPNARGLGAEALVDALHCRL